MFTLNQPRAAGGSSSPSVPAWTYVAGGAAPSGGKFTANSETIASATTINISKVSYSGDAEIPSFVNVGFFILVDSAAKPSYFSISSVSDGGSYFILTVTVLSAQSGTWDGIYDLSFGVGIPHLDQVLSSSSITPVTPGTYTVGLGVSTNGTITIADGVITAVQEATP